MSSRTQQERANTPLIWTIIELFYTARTSYLRVHDRYEDLVAHYVRLLGKPRGDIRLEPKELAELLKFKELERLRDSLLLPLKDSCHMLFRGTDSTDFLDRLVNDIFHEISILKEEHYNVLTYEPTATGATREELDTILDEVHTMFPIKVHRLKHLFGLAQARIEKLLPEYHKNRVLIRSLFLHRQGFVADAYPDGVVQFYRLLYGENRPQDGFLEAGESFARSGFLPYAIDCYRAGLQFLRGISPAAKRRLHPSWKDARARMEKAVLDCENKQESQEEE